MGLCEKPDKASDTAKKKGGDKKIDDPSQQCPLEQEEDANIVSIAWLDGGDDIETASAEQYVNLPRDDKWVNGDEIKNKDRLGLKPRMKVHFDKEGCFPFTVKLLTPTGTAPYTDPEKGRNGDFKYTEDEKSYTTDADGTKIIDGDFQLVAGGGYKFKARAKDQKDKVVKTGDLTTMRLFYYVEAKMTGLGSILSSTAPVESEYAKHFIVLKKLPALSIPRQSNIGDNSDSSTLASNVNAAVNAENPVKEKKPYLLTVAYTDHLAVKHPDVVVRKENVEVGPGKSTTIPVMAAGLIAPHTMKARHLWHDLVPGEGWFVEAKYQNKDGDESSISEHKVNRGSTWKELVVDLSELSDGPGTVEVTVHVVDRMRGGLALSGANQTCVCSRSWWANRSDAKQECTIIHEVGHKIYMVTDGTGEKPDKVDTHYSGKGHVGNHCCKGCDADLDSYSATAQTSKSECVMFGTVNQKNAFCDNCEKAVKKMDISSGW